MGGGYTMNEIEIIKLALKTITTKQKSVGYKPTGLYPYTDIDGNILYVRFRLDHPTKGKFIRPLSRDENGNWNQLKEPTFEDGKPIYNLHLIAKEPDKPVFIVEGEKCADALRKLGILATTSGSATSAKDANWKILANRYVVLWFDNDEAGKQYALDVIASLKALNINIKVIDVNALNLPLKGDCVDYIAQFNEEKGRECLATDIHALKLNVELVQLPVSHSKKNGDTLPEASPISTVIAELSKLTPIEYDRVRKEKAKELGIQQKTLDDEVKQERISKKPDDTPFKDIEPWHEAINPADLLDEITATIKQFIVLDDAQAKGCTLWVAASWFINEIQCAPILLINAPEKACGKTQLLTVLAKLAPRTVQASGISSSVLFRMIEAYQPTLFVDEIETVLKDNEELRGLINAGHTRDSAYVWRSVAKGDDFEPKRFTVWSMKAIAGINAIKLAETVTSRSIVIELRRKRDDESVERLRRAEPYLFETLSSKLARFSDDYSTAVKASQPELPNALSDRDQDNWEPLFQVANVAGGHWPSTAQTIAFTILNTVESPLSSANELLADIQEIFEAKGVVKIKTSELIEALCEDEEKPWATYNRGKRLAPRQLSTKLKGYGISSKTIRLNPYETGKGFEVEQFNDAFSRYLAASLILPSQVTKPLIPSPILGPSVTDKKSVTVTDTLSVTLEASPMLGSRRNVTCDHIFGGKAENKKGRNRDDSVVI